MMEDTEIVRELAELGSVTRRNSEDIDELKAEVKEVKQTANAIYDLSASIRTIAEQTQEIKTEVKEVKSSQDNMKNEISELRNAPIVQAADKWKKAVAYIATALGGAVVMYVVAQLFPMLGGN